MALDDHSAHQRILRVFTFHATGFSMSEDRLAAQGDMLTAMMKPPSNVVN
jgi:hypothetical protein